MSLKYNKVQSSIVNMIGRSHDHLMSMRHFTMMITIRYSYVVQIVRGKCLWDSFGFANHLVLITCFVS